VRNGIAKSQNTGVKYYDSSVLTAELLFCGFGHCSRRIL